VGVEFVTHAPPNAGQRCKFLPIAHHGPRLPVPVEIRPHVCTALAADPAGEALLDIGQPGIIGPRIAADRDGVATAVVGAIDQQAAHAHFAHFGERDLGRRSVIATRSRRPAASGTIGAPPPLADNAAGRGCVARATVLPSGAPRGRFGKRCNPPALTLNQWRCQKCRVRSEDRAMLFDIGREQRPMQFVRWEEGCQ